MSREFLPASDESTKRWPTFGRRTQQAAERLHALLQRHGIVDAESIPMTTDELTPYVKVLAAMDEKPEDFVDPDKVIDTYTWDWKKGVEQDRDAATAYAEEANKQRRKVQAENAVLRARLLFRGVDRAIAELEEKVA